MRFSKPLDAFMPRGKIYVSLSYMTSFLVRVSLMANGRVATMSVIKGQNNIGIKLTLFVFVNFLQRHFSLLNYVYYACMNFREAF